MTVNLDFTLTRYVSKTISLPPSGHLSAIIAAPQSRGEAYWRPQELSKFIDLVEKNIAVDENHICVMGYSMGGCGTWEFAQYAPDRLTAIVPLCGNGDPTSAEKLAKFPIWVFHVEQNDVTPHSGSREII